jgi:hypothetical protein
MRTATTSRESFALAATVKAALAVAELRLRPSDEGRQSINAATIGHRGLRLLLELRLVTLLAVVFALMMLVPRFARLVGLLMVARIIVALHEGLLLHRDESGLLTEARKTFIVIAVFLRDLGVRPGLRLVLPELFLGGRDQAEIVFGMLIVVLCCNRIAGGTRIAGQLHILLGHMGGRAADLDVWPVGFEHPGHWVLTAPVTAVIVVPVTHPLVLTVSHVVPFIPALNLP